jgi:integrase
VFWYDADHKRTRRESLRTSDPTQAKAHLAKWLTIGPNFNPYATTPGITVNEILDLYLDNHVRQRVRDKDRQRHAIVHLRVHFGRLSVKDVDIVQCRLYTAARRDGAIGGGARRPNGRAADGTIRRELNVLAAAARHAVKWKRLSADELPQIEIPTPPAREAPYLTKAQLRAVIAQADPDLADFILLAYYTGARRRSIEQLRVTQVDLRRGTINLNPAGRPVTVKRRPIVPIFPELREVLERRIAASGDGFLFAAPRAFYQPFVRLCRRMGVEVQAEGKFRDPWPHLLRHSRATHLLEDGENPYKVAKLLGDTLATVERVYGHCSTSYLQTDSNLDN